VEWVPGAVREHGASFDLIIGRWGEHTGPADRAAVSLAFRHTARGPEFMVVDARGRHHARPHLVAAALERTAVVGTPMAARAFAVVDAIWLHDERVGELVAPTGQRGAAAE
jgi:predicted outer membrane lipoprotein